MFYFYALVLVFFNLFIYVVFRGGIYEYLRLSKISKTYIRKNRKGVNNYWLYSQINREHSLGIIYFLNAIFLYLFIFSSVITILFGYLEISRIPIIVLTIILCLVEIPVLIWFSRIDSLMEYGIPFVLLKKYRHTRGYYSSVFFMLFWTIPAAFVLLCIKETFGI